MYNRCFTFGCSFTKYAWPTWADIIHHQADFPVTNWALPGLGNVGIASLMLECDLKYKFTDKDLILVMWSSWTREDRFLQGRWKSVGSVFANYYYDQTFIEKYWDWENDVIKNSNAILMANKCFDISAQFSIMPYGDKEFEKMIGPSAVYDFYRPHLPKVYSMDMIPNSRFKGSTVDDHPDILAHVKFYNQQIASRFKLPVVKDNSIFHLLQEELSNVFDPKAETQANCDLAWETIDKQKDRFPPSAIFAPHAPEVKYY